MVMKIKKKAPAKAPARRRNKKTEGTPGKPKKAF